ncbi:hypothetical protein Tco_0687851, partial [Tanacetum coccineum]
LIKEKLIAARDCQKGCVGNRRKHLELKLEVSSWKDVLHFGKKDLLAPRYYWTDANLHVHLEEIKVDKTLCFAEEPVEIIDCEVKSLKRSRILIVKSIGTRSESCYAVILRSRDEISLRRGYCDNCALSRRVGYKSIERDRPMVIKVMVAMDISLFACRDLEAAFEYPGEHYEGVEVNKSG